MTAVEYYKENLSGKSFRVCFGSEWREYHYPKWVEGLEITSLLKNSYSCGSYSWQPQLTNYVAGRSSLNQGLVGLNYSLYSHKYVEAWVYEIVDSVINMGVDPYEVTELDPFEAEDVCFAGFEISENGIKISLMVDGVESTGKVYSDGTFYVGMLSGKIKK